MSERILANRASERTDGPPEEAAAVRSALSTCDRMIRLKIPNFLRLYLNPFVAQTCLAISELIHAAWPGTRKAGPRPSFLANSGEEALSGAIKLARYTINSRSRAAGESPDAAHTILIDELPKFRGFASAAVTVESGREIRVGFVQKIDVMSTSQLCAAADSGVLGELKDLVVVVASVRPSSELTALADHLQRIRARGGLVIICLQSDWEDSPLVSASSPSATAASASTGGMLPDLVVFDETFTDQAIPFGAFSAEAGIYAQWTRRGMSAFHSTTFQPNTISAMHFLSCLEENSAAFFRRIQPQLRNLLVDHHLLRRTYKSLFSPSLGRLILASGFADDDVTAMGHFVRAGSRRLFDGIGGVACSLRGHNPEDWVVQMESLKTHRSLQTELRERLSSLTGLNHCVPAVSGASAVEQALKLALVAQAPRRTIVALQGGFGGKTLLALAGTSRGSYKTNLGPLYPHVIYLDPFDVNAAGTLRDLVAHNDVAVIQLELIQGVGGVREIPQSLLEAVQDLQEKSGILVFVDEIQTGMFRTGPFVRSESLRFQPDLITIGKGTSDMVIPFAMTLFGDRVNQLLQQRNSDLPELMTSRNSCELGFRSVLNTLRRAQDDDLSATVLAAGRRFELALKEQLQNVRMVRDVRVFGLLVGIELDPARLLLHRCGVNTVPLILAQMMRNRDYPLLMGFCQYDPSILKFTPPLTVTADETERVCRSIAETLRCSSVQLLRTAVAALWRLRRS